jgi:hypothetical protein
MINFSRSSEVCTVNPRYAVVYCSLKETTDNCHVKWVPCHHGMARPQIADGGDGLQIRRVKVKSHNTCGDVGGEELWLPLILYLDTRWGWVERHAPTALYPQGKDHRYPLCRRLGSPRAGLDTKATGKILFLCRESNLVRPVVQSVARHHTDWAIPAPRYGG